MTSEEVIRAIRQETDTVLLAFSRGKNSLGAWLALRPHFTRIVPVYMYGAPPLSFVERSLAYYEEFFGCRIARYPQPFFYDRLATGTFSTPASLAVIRRARLDRERFSRDDVFRAAAEDNGLPADTWTAIGVRSSDSLYRRTSITRHGAINRKRRTFFPCHDWTIDRLMGEIRDAGVLLPADYRMYGRSLDGVQALFSGPMRDHHPEDYRRLEMFFPLMAADQWRRHYGQTQP